LTIYQSDLSRASHERASLRCLICSIGHIHSVCSLNRNPNALLNSSPTVPCEAPTCIGYL